MKRHTRLAHQAWQEAGAEVRLLVPPSFLSARLHNARLRKWVGYIEKFLIFIPSLRAAARQSDLVHIPDHSDAIWILQLPSNIRTRVTVHDLFAVRAALGEIPEHQPRWSGRLYQRLVLGGLRRTRDLVADSAATAADVERVVGTAARVAYLPLEEDFWTPSDSPRNHLLTVCPPGWRKNRERAIETWLALRKMRQFESMPLVIVGPQLTDAERALLPATLRPDVRCDVPDEGLRELYRSAAVTLVLSQYEGFGWPILEARACGSAVLISEAEALVEIGGDEVVIAPGGNDKDWSGTAEALRALLDRRPDLARFSWSNFVDSYAGSIATP